MDRWDMGSRVVDLGLAMFLAGGLNIGLALLWWPLWLVGIGPTLWLGNRFLNAVADLAFDDEEPQ